MGTGGALGLTPSPRVKSTIACASGYCRLTRTEELERRFSRSPWIAPPDARLIRHPPWRKSSGPSVPSRA
jgi:hypothetical protein